MIIEQIAKVCHEVNREYCKALGDDTQYIWDAAPSWQKDSAIKGVTMLLQNPKAGPEATHESWAKEKLADGWKHGITKDPEKKEHPCLVDFECLPVEQQAKDYIFRAIVHALRDL